MSNFEDLWDDIGSFGPFQRRVFILVSLFETPAALMMFLPVFIQAIPKVWHCTSNELFHLTNSTSTVINTVTVLNAIQERSHSSNETSEHTQYCDNQGFYCDSGENVTFEIDRQTIANDFALCDKPGIIAWITPVQMVGVFLGACIFGQLADSCGRRLVFYIVYTLMLVAGFLTALTPNWQAYMACRFFVGVFFGGTMVINFVLPIEFVGAKWRTFCGCIGFWALGTMLLAPLAYWIRAWRTLCMVCAGLGVPLLFTWWWVPESPRWLIQQGRIAEANAIIARIANYNKKQVPGITKLEQIACLDADRIREHKKYSYWDLFRTCNMTKNTLIVVYSWFVGSSVYYGTSFNAKSLSGDKYVNFFLLGLAEIPAVLFVVLVNNRLGRKKTVSLLMLTAGLSCFVIVALYILGKEDETKTLIFSMLGKFGIAGAWAAAQVFSAELFPTVVRNIGIGACSMAARLGGISAPVIVEFANAPHRISLSPLPFAIFGCLAFACGVLSFFLPETQNRPLPERLPRRRGCCRGMREEESIQEEPYIDVEDANGHAPHMPVMTSQNGAAHVLREGGGGGGVALSAGEELRMEGMEGRAGHC